jgi:hypothetical protein
MSLAKGKMPTRCPITPPSGMAPPLADSGSIALVPGTMSSSAFLYGLGVRAYAFSISTSMNAYEERYGTSTHSLKSRGATAH